MKHAKRTLRKLNYLPRWAWYALSFFLFTPFGPVVVYLVFHALTRAAQDEDADEDTQDWMRFATTYMDEDCMVTDDEEVLRRWQETQANARRASAARQTVSSPPDHAGQQEDASGQAPGQEEDAVADVIREGRAAMRRIRQANDVISDAALSAQIDSIENSCRQILSILEQRPQLLSQLRTFLRYYLPTTLKLLDARARLENSASTPKALEVRTRISEAVSVIDKAFKKQVEALDEYRFIDLESEMDVLRDMLKADGLIDEQQDEDDPFAEVLSNRRSSAQRAQEKSGGTPMATP